jgi:hypothetical protein
MRGILNQKKEAQEARKTEDCQKPENSCREGNAMQDPQPHAFAISHS